MPRVVLYLQDNNVMSIDIDWESLTAGPDGSALAETVRAFIHDKFQQIALPRFIKSVEVHSFDFGKQCPTVELKDICDPLPDFYDSDGGEDEDEEQAEDSGAVGERDDKRAIGIGGARPGESLRERREASRRRQYDGAESHSTATSTVPTTADAWTSGRSNLSLADQMASPLLTRSGTPGIPGGTSNLSYFHLPLSSGMPGTQTPLAAVAVGTPFQANWQDFHAPPWEHHLRHPRVQSETSRHIPQHHAYPDPSTRPSTATSFPPQRDGFARQDSIDGTAERSDSDTWQHEADPMDLQIVMHICYSGDIRLSLTVEILLDYPMPSFVGIPLKLNITGLTFDGVALIAYVKSRVHFCFLAQEDAMALVATEKPVNGQENEENGPVNKEQQGDKLGGLLREIRVESEIGQKESGKQVLKNVGKVEKFVLEQVRRIFEDEFVYPSFWTVLV